MEVFVFGWRYPTPALPGRRKRGIASRRSLCFFSVPRLRKAGMGDGDRKPSRCHSHPRRRTNLRQLRMHIAPLTHAQRRQEIFMQHLIKFAMRLLVLERVFIKFPQLHEAHELRLRMHKFLVRQRGFLLLVVRSISRVLHRQCRSDDEHFLQRAFNFSGDQHSCDGRIDREPGELPTQRGEAFVFIDRTQLKQLPVAVLDHARARWLDEREFLHVAQTE